MKSTRNKSSKRAYKFWTPEEDKIILDYMSKHPGNLQASFRHLASILGREARTVSNRWYVALRYNGNKSFILFGRTKGMLNTKIVTPHTNPNVLIRTKGLWSKLLSVLGIKK